MADDVKIQALEARMDLLKAQTAEALVARDEAAQLLEEALDELQRLQYSFGRVYGEWKALVDPDDELGVRGRAKR